MAKQIFITGGVVSSLGKGLTSASIAMLLARRGYRVVMQKLDPYINVDPGTMSPYQHGEVYVTVDGAETDLDLGHYERFTEIDCTQGSNYTTGKIYDTVIKRERQGGYLGKTVQVIPHITNEIKASIQSMHTDDVDIVMTEIGGTVGDIESQPFLEAIRQFRQEIGKDNGVFLHLTLLPYLGFAGEMKTKPSQQSVGLLRSIGILPDILCCRCEKRMEAEHREKLALFCNVDPDFIIDEVDVANTIYEVPLDLTEQKVDVKILELLDLPANEIDLDAWRNMVKRLIEHKKGEIEIAVVGKYISLTDSYKSIYESLTHGGIASDVKVIPRMIESEDLEEKGLELLEGVSGVLVPGGFGSRGIEGKMMAIGYARENNIPFFGICLGMQCAVMEFARNVCGLEKADSTEFRENTPNPVIDLMEHQKAIRAKGGTMRLGAYPCVLKEGSKAYEAYGKTEISERHRHRYEYNNSFRDIMVENGLVLSGLSPDGELVEVVELPNHPWFVASQYHPEFQSRPMNAHPLFREFIKAAVKYRDDKS
jgi:CTP synthase